MAEHPAITQRPPAYAELLVDSMDRYKTGFSPTPTTSSDWKLQLQNYALNGYLTRLSVSQIQFFWNLPTIISNYNDQFRVIYSSGGAPTGLTVTVPQGFYTPDELATALETALNNALPAATWTVAYSQLDACFIIDVAGAGYTFSIAAPPAGANRLSRFYETAGFMRTGMTAGTQQFGMQPTMLPTRFVDLCSSYLTKFQRLKDFTTLPASVTTNVIARIYPTAPNTRVPLVNDASVGSTPFTLCIDYNTPKHIRWSPEESVTNFDLQLRDENGDLLPFDTATGAFGCEYQLTILASES